MDGLTAKNSGIELSAQTLPCLRKVSSATVTMVLLKRGIRACFIEGAAALDTSASNFVAEAFTLRFIPMREDISTPSVLGDPNYAQRKLIEEIPAGAALVIDARGITTVGTLGGILAVRLKERGCAAVVSDGAVRDVAELRALGMPIYCAGPAAPASLGAHYSSEYQVPIACGNVAVIPGDVLIGDADGVVLIPRTMADEVAQDAFEQERLEGFLLGLIEQGRPAIGTYPPNEAVMAEYRDWLKSQDQAS